MTDRRLRRMQALSPFGVGAIVDMLGESFVAEDATRWKGRRMTLAAPRIAAHFGAEELRLPPAPRDGKLPYYRFPQWLFCGTCRTMAHWSVRQEQPGKIPRCQHCGRSPQLVPMRFVAVCGNGHLDDVPWVQWAHSGGGQGREQRQCGRAELQFEHLTTVGGGLESLRVRCRTCRAGRNLAELTSPRALGRINIRCRGRQPWQRDTEAVSCDQPPVVLQRGASSVYFPDTGSAIDLPPDSDWVTWGGTAARVEQNPYFALLHKDPEGPMREQLIGFIAEQENVNERQVIAILNDRLGATGADAGSETPEDLAEREWQALTNPRRGHHPDDRFITRRTPFPASTGHGRLNPVVDRMRTAISDIVLVDRLREVRVLRGFRRHTMDTRIPADLGTRSTSLPAVEVYGEGIFLVFDEANLRRWELQTHVVRRATTLHRRFAGSMHARWIESSPTPRLILLHSIAHLLMRQLAFDAGYPSSSLRERIYASTPDSGTPMAGVLIYTAAGDAEGTLGGLARSGEAGRLVTTIAATLAAARWCSLDPVCRESKAQGPSGLSMAACHACSLVPETSCTMGNVLLDRTLVIDDEYGFMRDPLAELIAVQAGAT
ncbi:DrmB family protein [Micromonospora arborensis]|uniref:DrmB family protein n=1 Tax=Micromonospora arborensis TaxID=2116518 RepID=UPI00372364FC